MFFTNCRWSWVFNSMSHFKMAAIRSFHAEKCCHLVCAHAAAVYIMNYMSVCSSVEWLQLWRSCSPVIQWNLTQRWRINTVTLTCRLNSPAAKLSLSSTASQGIGPTGSSCRWSSHTCDSLNSPAAKLSLSSTPSQGIGPTGSSCWWSSHTRYHGLDLLDLYF